ncbi:MAG: mechanosensitive ion channel family protein [Candidatus Woesearchaeota archaeon]
MLDDFFMQELFGNTIGAYALAALYFLGLVFFFKIFKYVILKRLGVLAKKTTTKIDEAIVDFLLEIKGLFYYTIALYIVLHTLFVPQIILTIVYYLLYIICGFYVAKGFSHIVNHVVEDEIKKRKEKEIKGSSSMIRVMGAIIKAILWLIIMLMVLANWGIEITPLIASMGIGGIAIALALQTILGDLFGAFVIYFDKPFEEGDFIIVGGDMGVVKHIGIKSTRIQALQGQELVMSNTELINSRVNNYKQMQKRRIAFAFGVTYDTGAKKLEKIKKIVIDIFEKMDDADLDRVHFQKFGDFSLDYEVVYYIDTADYNTYMDIQEKINLALYRRFEKEKIDFAFPTQTIELHKK